jgi:exopolysaccharide biosynthesis polyprenyl glycosylphosphotransferase
MPLSPFRHNDRRLLLLTADIAAAVAAVALSLWTWQITAGTRYDGTFVGQREWYLAVPVWVLALSHARHPHYVLDLRRTSIAIFQAAVVLFGAYLMVFFASGRAVLPRLMAIYVVWDAIWLTLACRMVAGWLMLKRGRERRVLVVGEGLAIQSALEMLSHPSFGDLHVAEVVTNGAVSGSQAADLLELAAAVRATDLVVALTGDPPAHVVEGALLCQVRGLEVVALSELYEQTFRRVPVRHLGPSWVLANLVGTAHLRGPSLAKRTLDLAASTIVGLVALVSAPIIAIAILLESGRPVFYRQIRLGRGGREFLITKFRTMRQDAEKAGPQWSTVDDPRTTRVGRFLRRTRLDELPNVWSVIKGDMSMVGPRPERPAFIDMLEAQVPLYRARLAVPPGLTGWAQVTHSYTDSVEDAITKLEYDLYYVKHQSLAFDLAILARTCGTMLHLRGR